MKFKFSNSHGVRALDLSVDLKGGGGKLITVDFYESLKFSHIPGHKATNLSFSITSIIKPNVKQNTSTSCSMCGIPMKSK